MSQLTIEDLHVTYAGGAGTVDALVGYSLVVPPGSLTVLLGESGCGKTTALNAVAGLLQPRAGRIRLGDEVLFERPQGRGRGTSLPPNRRDIGMVFQSYALWPHMTVLDNVMYPVLRRKGDRGQAQRAAHAALDTVRCGAFAQRFPGELSGGQQQRIALARALVARPKLLLFDEPLSNLDASLRRGLRDELARLHHEIGFTGIYVTHDQAEALALGTSLAVMDRGRIVQAAAAQEVYECPANEFVARFFGANVLEGKVTQRGTVETGAGLVRITDTALHGPVHLAFMPHATRVEADPDGPLEVIAALYVGSQWEIRLAGSDCEVLAFHPVQLPVPRAGSRARLVLAPEQVRAFDAAASRPAHAMRSVAGSAAGTAPAPAPIERRRAAT